MHEFFEFIGRIAWPLVAAGFLIFFRSEIRAAFSRLKEVGLSGVKLDSAAPKQVPPPPATEVIAGTAKDFISGVKQFIDSEQLDPAVANFRRDLSAYTQNKDDQLEIMIYAAASANIQLTHERIYRTIFGSQIAVLDGMNAVGGITEEAAKKLYENTVAHSPEFYKSFSFENWIGFLLKTNLAKKVGSNYEATAYGRGFLKYVLDMRLISAKPH